MDTSDPAAACEGRWHLVGASECAWRATLSDQQIAAAASYVRSSWGNKAGPVTPELVAQLRQSLATRDKPWSAAELH